MTETAGLGRIEKADLRNAWPHEAADFTPWLVDHVSELGAVSGLELELQSSEAPVGTLSLDLLARDTGTNRAVIIENQLEPTDHDHLAKLLTYAGGYDANVIVWVAKDFRDEHRQALDWLNQHTDEDTEFFGVVVEVGKLTARARPRTSTSLPLPTNGAGKLFAACGMQRRRIRPFATRRFSRNSWTRSESEDSRMRVRRSFKVGTTSRRGTRNAFNTAPLSPRRKEPGLKFISITPTGIGTRFCSTASWNEKNPSNPNSRNRLHGNAWTVAGRAALRSCARVALTTTRRR